MEKKKLLIFASGSKTGGGSGFENLVKAERSGMLNAKIVGVVSNHEHGGVRERADRLGVPFIHFPLPREAEDYQRIVRETGADFMALSGWLKLVKGLDPKTTFNIHPGPLPRFGGENMWGHHVHEAVLDAYKRGRVTHSAVSMHFVTEKYDEGPVFFQVPVEIKPTDTVDDLATRVNAAEHHFQPILTDLVVNGAIYWDGKNLQSLVVQDTPSLGGLL